ncbi:MAG: zinc ribbon domain-containing protein [Acidimicrobiia bacterium]
MPIYEYRCRTCEERFELRRSMAEADEPASCSSGHGASVRLLATFASTGRAAAAAPAGGCGAGCACHAG